MRISDNIRQNPRLIVILSGIRPEYVNNQFLYRCVDLVYYL